MIYSTQKIRDDGLKIDEYRRSPSFGGIGIIHVKLPLKSKSIRVKSEKNAKKALATLFLCTSSALPGSINFEGLAGIMFNKADFQSRHSKAQQGKDVGAGTQ